MAEKLSVLNPFATQFLARQVAIWLNFLRHSSFFVGQGSDLLISQHYKITFFDKLYTPKSIVKAELQGRLFLFTYQSKQG